MATDGSVSSGGDAICFLLNGLPVCLAKWKEFRSAIMAGDIGPASPAEHDHLALLVERIAMCMSKLRRLHTIDDLPAAVQVSDAGPNLGPR